MQKRWWVGGGPSLKRWPRWQPHRLQSTSVRCIPPEVSGLSSTAAPPAAAQKDGQPVPLSNFVAEAKRGVWHAAQT